MTELNKTNIPEKEWNEFIKDIVAVQDKHKIILVPTLKLNQVQGVLVEWGGIRQDNEVSKTKQKGASGDEVSQTEGAK